MAERSAAAEISGPPALIENLTPEFLMMVGRNFIRKGELVAEIDVSDGRVRYHASASHDVTGGIDSRDWIYRMHFSGPQKTEDHPAA